MRFHHLALALALLPACGDEDTATDTHDHDHDHDHDMGGEIAFDMAVSPVFGDETFSCTGSFAAPTGSATVEFRDFKFYLSEIALIDADGVEHEVTLTQDGTWQHENVVLIDAEDATGNCSESGDTPMNLRIQGLVEEGEYTAMVFTVGVPFDLNHTDTAAAPPPLNLPTMMWNWQGGRKFVRLDMNNDQAAPDNAWFFHLGSTGCASADPVSAPMEECAKPNKPRITVQGNPLTDSLVIDIEALLDQVDIGSDTPDTPVGCMSNPADTAECPNIFANIGLDFDSGTCLSGDCNSQVGFTLE